jgi:hypothetical protein
VAFNPNLDNAIHLKDKSRRVELEPMDNADDKDEGNGGNKGGRGCGEG